MTQAFIFIFEVVVWVFPCVKLRVDEGCHYYSSRANTAMYSSLYLMIDCSPCYRCFVFGSEGAGEGISVFL